MAALLFDYLVPVHSSAGVPDQVRFRHPDLTAFGKTSADEDLRAGVKRARELIQKHPESWVQKIVAAVPRDQLAELRGRGLTDQEIAAAETCVHHVRNTHTAQIHRILTADGVRAVPLFRSICAYETYISPGNTQAVEISLINAPLIDTSSLAWRDILAIRQDTNFTRNLRNFRLFLNANYRDKDPGYVMDDLNRKLDEYESSCRRYGLHLGLAALHQTLCSKSLLGTLGIAAVAVLVGSPVESVAVAGAVLEVGKLAISVALKNLELGEGVAWSELAYLAEISSLAGTHRTSSSRQ
jgi:hypothetical protein